MLPRLKITCDLRAITVHAPWAWAIVSGYKLVENRTWVPRFRGQIAIHAGQSKIDDVIARQQFEQLGLPVPDDFARGMILGTAELVDVLPLDAYLKKYGVNAKNRAFAQGPYCWVLRDPVLCREIKCSGNFQLWNVEKQLKKRRNKKESSGKKKNAFPH